MTALNFRMLPPNAVGQQTITINGRSYTAAPGATLDVVDFDAGVLAANGWIKVAPSGPTASRPTTNPNANPPYIAAGGVHFVDTTIAKLIVHDGLTWRDPTTGAAV